MDTLQNNFPDEEFYNIQIKLRKWLRRNGFSTWKQIQKTCRTLLEAYPNEYSDLYGKYPEYKLFMPLLRNGICELSKQNDKTGFLILPKENEETPTLNPLILLNNFPTINDIVRSYKIEESVDLKFYSDLYDKYSYKPIEDNKKSIGIFKPQDRVYENEFIFDGKQQRILPKKDDNPDSINVARSFVRIKNNQQLFKYHSLRKELNTYYYSELPILITRALILFDVSQLKDRKYKYPLTMDIPYKNIDDKVVNELLRIFGNNCIEVSND